MNLLKLLSILAVALVLGACGGASLNRSSPSNVLPSNSSTGSAAESAPQSGAPQSGASQAAAPAAAVGGAALDSGGSQQNSATNKLPSEQLFDRLVIKNADLTLQVEDVSK